MTISRAWFSVVLISKITQYPKVTSNIVVLMILKICICSTFKESCTTCHLVRRRRLCLLYFIGSGVSSSGKGSKTFSLELKAINLSSILPVADFTVKESPLVVLFRDRYNVPMVLRFNEIHKFSDGTLQMVEEALDFRVKEYHVYHYGSRRYTNHWKDHDLTLNKKFLAGIHKRLKLR